jgi:hypothetical protein
MTFDLAEYYFVTHDELDIEADLLLWRRDSFDGEGGQESKDHTRETIVGVLRTIDQTKATGVYSKVRRELKKAYPSPPPPSPEAIEMFDTIGLVWSKLSSLLNSPDTDQRHRIDLMMHRHGYNRMPVAMWADVIMCLEEPLRKPGRPKVNPPWRPHSTALDEMRRLVMIKGETIAAAARIASSRTQTPWAKEESQAKKLERYYRKRMKLRE